MREERKALICLSHLRWGFVYQRPQHLLTRFARSSPVFYVEEPHYSEGEPRLDVRVDDESGVTIVVPHLPHGTSGEVAEKVQSKLLRQLIQDERIDSYRLWYYTPMALGFTRDLSPSLVVYDCMDELSAFQGAPPQLKEREKELFRRADLVFTGGRTLYEAKRDQHDDVHAFPSSVDVSHFAQARVTQEEPADQAAIPHPRIGFCGVIDERLDIQLLRDVAAQHPEWHFVMIGPVVKIDPATLPQGANIHYLGGKDYRDLPKYLSGWDAAMLPFARNESTRFISPTKTPEYLAAGLPTVSTSIRDVVTPYGDLDLVKIGDDVDSFAAGISIALSSRSPEWEKRVDGFLANNSWETTWSQMSDLITIRERELIHV